MSPSKHHERRGKPVTPTKLLRDCVGSSLVEFSLVFPIFILVALGTVDVGLMLSEWAQANKATYLGAHRATVSDPVAPGLATFFNDTIVGGMGLQCFDTATGNASGNCLTIPPIVCTSTACTPNTYGWSSAAFTEIFTPMQRVFSRLQQGNVTISYQRPANLNNLGWNEPNGFPMEVTVSITGMTHQFFFVGPLVSFLGGFITSTPGIPQYRTTLIGEDMCSDGTSVSPPTVCGF
jgi:Flp pilus assembly protein TadG